MDSLKLVLIQMSNTYWQWYIQPAAPAFTPELAIHSGNAKTLRGCIKQAKTSGVDWGRITYTYMNRHATTAGQ